MAVRSTKTRRPAASSKIEAARKKIVPVSEQFQHLRMLVYGKPKKGKTTFGASGPKPVIIIDCNEQGTLSVRNFPDAFVYPVETWTDIDMIFWFLHNGAHEYQTVVIDTLTSLASLCMKFVLGDEASRDPTKDPTMPSKREWGKVGQLMGTEILKFRNLPMNIIFLAQEKRGYTEDEEEVPEVMPAVSPSVLQTLTPAVDIIGRLYVKEVVSKRKGEDGKIRRTTTMERRMLIGDHEIYTTGDRSEAGLPSVLRLPAADKRVALEKLISRIKNAKEG